MLALGTVDFFIPEVEDADTLIWKIDRVGHLDPAKQFGADFLNLNEQLGRIFGLVFEPGIKFLFTIFR